jgi:hypothetical protein
MNDFWIIQSLYNDTRIEAQNAEIEIEYLKQKINKLEHENSQLHSLIKKNLNLLSEACEVMV